MIKGNSAILLRSWAIFYWCVAGAFYLLINHHHLHLYLASFTVIISIFILHRSSDMYLPLWQHHTANEIRWTEYNWNNSPRAHLLNSHALSEETNLALVNINGSTHVRWFKNHTRMNEIKILKARFDSPESRSLCKSSPTSSTTSFTGSWSECHSWPVS